MNWTIEHRDSIALLTFSRPPENFMDFGSMIELGDLLEDLAAQPDHVKVIMLAGGTDGVFINHADPSDLVKAGEGRTTPQEAGSWARALRLLEQIPQPAIAAIDGLASGGGNEITLACTLRLGSERIRLQQPEVGAGIIPGGGGSVRLPRLVGPGIAAEAVITGRAFGAQESLRAGWINAVLPTRGFNDQALLWAAAIVEKPAPALNAAKRSIVFGSRMTFADALALEHQMFSDLSATSKVIKTETAQ
jgi:enoyl-CoA hydratase